MIQLVPYFLCTHLHTSSLSFIVSSIQSNVVGEIKVSAVFCFDLIQCFYDSTHYIFLMHPYSYFITHIHCFVDSIDNRWEQWGKSICFFIEYNFRTIQFISSFWCNYGHTSSLTFVFLYIFPIYFVNLGSTKLYWNKG